MPVLSARMPAARPRRAIARGTDHGLRLAQSLRFPCRRARAATSCELRRRYNERQPCRRAARPSIASRCVAPAGRAATAGRRRCCASALPHCRNARSRRARAAGASSTTSSQASSTSSACRRAQATALPSRPDRSPRMLTSAFVSAPLISRTGGVVRMAPAPLAVGRQAPARCWRGRRMCRSSFRCSVRRESSGADAKVFGRRAGREPVTPTRSRLARSGGFLAPTATHVQEERAVRGV